MHVLYDLDFNLPTPQISSSNIPKLAALVAALILNKRDFNLLLSTPTVLMLCSTLFQTETGKVFHPQSDKINFPANQVLSLNNQPKYQQG